jgi:hypothetical protein
LSLIHPPLIAFSGPSLLYFDQDLIGILDY